MQLGQVRLPGGRQLRPPAVQVPLGPGDRHPLAGALPQLLLALTVLSAKPAYLALAGPTACRLLNTISRPGILTDLGSRGGPELRKAA
jgi:hypothetical protein